MLYRAVVIASAMGSDEQVGSVVGPAYGHPVLDL